MYTSYIGKKFLKLYNEREGVEISAKSFFETVFFQLFFEDESHLMHVHGSSFFQKVSPNALIGGETKSSFQLKRLNKNINDNKISGSTFVGYAAETALATTSGQVSSLPIEITSEEMYASWIGETLAMGVSGGFLMLIDEPEILWALHQGWSYYRQYLNQTPHVKDKQIETWNGHWICHCFGRNFNPDSPLDELEIETSETQGKIAIPTKKWTDLIFALARKYPNEILTAYAYNLSQTNTTLGFINLYLPQVRQLHQLRDHIFINKKDTILTQKELEDFSPYFHFKEACKLGTIGLKALEPDKLRTYMPSGSVPFAGGKDYKFTDESSYIDYQIFKIWIIAMINKTELLNLASEVAKALIELASIEDRGKKVFSAIADEIKNSKNLKSFIENLTKALENTPKGNSYAETFKQTVEQVLKMPSDNFPLFVTLIRFEYQYQSSK